MTIAEFQEKGEAALKACLLEADAVSNLDDLNVFKGRHLGKKSALTGFYQMMRSVDPAERKEFGILLSRLKDKIEAVYAKKASEIEAKLLSEKMARKKVDITLPGFYPLAGAIHPYQKVVREITDFFVGLGFDIADGPEVESDENNFAKMNIPMDHPARDMQDSFSIAEGVVLRSHTSAVQARVMAAMKGKAPIKVICPGKVYRRDNDATHSHQFGQIEGLVISRDATFANLIEILTKLLRHLFGEKRAVRFRPSFFPFTEPSIEADISCFECDGKGCSFCKHTGWIEILGAGMVHPNVLRLNGYDAEELQGFAFGLGIDRIAMLKYGIDDIKRLYADEADFLAQFRKE